MCFLSHDIRGILYLVLLYGDIPINLTSRRNKNNFLSWNVSIRRPSSASYEGPRTETICDNGCLYSYERLS